MEPFLSSEATKDVALQKAERMVKRGYNDFPLPSTGRGIEGEGWDVILLQYRDAPDQESRLPAPSGRAYSNLTPANELYSRIHFKRGLVCSGVCPPTPG